MKRIFAIGDIHGCLDRLVSIFDRLRKEAGIDPEEDCLVFLGDYIDRGPDPYGVVCFLLEIRDAFRHAVFLKGNHEDLLLNYLAGKDVMLYMANGGRRTLDSYLAHSSSSSSLIPESHLSFFHSLLIYYETDEYYFVHAGFKPGLPVFEQSPADCLWIRESFVDSDYDFGKRVIFGHTPFGRPHVQDNKIGIDTGAVYGNMLTCLELPALRFYTA